MGTRITFFLKHTIFWLFGFIYLITLYFKFNDSIKLWVNGYIADFLCIPIVLYLTKTLLLIKVKKIEAKLSFLKILVAVVYFSIIFEWLLPMYSMHYTSDLLDVFMYALGGLVFYLIQRASL